MKVLIVYYSTYGNVYHMAALVAEGVKEIPGVQPVVRTVPELIPTSVIDSREDMKAGKAMQQDVPLVTMDDFRDALDRWISLGACAPNRADLATLKQLTCRFNERWKRSVGIFRKEDI